MQNKRTYITASVLISYVSDPHSIRLRVISRFKSRFMRVVNTNFQDIISFNILLNDIVQRDHIPFVLYS